MKIFSHQFLVLLIFFAFYPLGILIGQGQEERIIFISDINEGSEGESFQNILKRTSDSKESTTLVFLGGYTKSVKDSEDDEFEFLHEIKDFNNIKFAFIPGFEDWGSNRPSGYKYVNQANSEILDILDEKAVFVAENACPGPYEIEINEKLVLILINDYWLLNDQDVPLVDEGCTYSGKLDFLLELEECLKRNRKKNIILSGINPLASDGPKGGRFKFKHHLFPFNISNSNNYIPLPIFGSLYIAYRKLIGNADDLSNFKNKFYRKYLISLLKDRSNILYVASGEDNLDYREIEGIPQIIVGSLSNTSYSKPKNSIYNSTITGYTEVKVLPNGKTYFSFIEGNQLVFNQEILIPMSEESNPKTLENEDYSGQSITMAADKNLGADKKKRPGLMGLNYRKEWSVDISNVDYFNWGKEVGDLHIVQRGGGQQTRSLRLENNDKKQYVLRSIKKYPESAVPAEIRGTIFADLVYDQISASHPYAAFAIPKLAEAATIYHTNPKLVYLSGDSRLGEFKDDFENGLFLYEERPAKNRNDIASFGNSKDIMNTFEAIEKSQKSAKHQIDQDWVLKSRLFDIWIGDWDRHDDQWRWAKFKSEDDIKIYRPVPRDRDQAFFYSDGIILNLASRKWGIPKFQGFESKIRDINGLSFNARYFDRTFLTEPELEDWIKTATQLQVNLTDSIIEEGINDLPKEIFDINGETIINKLKQRRDDLPAYAEKFHQFLSKTVDVTGTNKKNVFTVERKKNGDTKLTVFEKDKDYKNDSLLVFERDFKYGVTKEIRLYGLKGKDEFYLNGEGKKGIKVRIIGGGGKDKIFDQSKVKGLGKKTIVYDKKKSTEILKSSETANRTSNSDDVNEYNRYAFKYNKVAPFAFIKYNPDDGIYIGGGPVITTHGFRKEPFKSNHKLLGNISPKSANYNLSYNGEFTDVIKKLDFTMDAIIATPSFSTFFYGIGNNTIYSEEKQDEVEQYYRVRFDLENIKMGLRADSKNQKHKLNFGLNYLRARIEEDLNEDADDDPRFILDYARDSLESSAFNQYRFLGPNLEYDFDTRDSKVFTKRGQRLKIEATYLQDLIGSKYNSLRISGSESVYLTLSRRFKAILALRAGGAAILGDYPFFIAPSIGGLATMRGHRRNRFRGDYSFYQNAELRLRLFKFQSEFLIGDFGLLILHDVGRVWADRSTDLSTIYSPEELQNNSNTQTLHRGYGFGFWLAPFNMAVLSADYSIGTDNDDILFVRLGFMF